MPDWAGDASATGAAEWEQTSPELTYIHDTLMTAMQDLRTLGREGLKFNSQLGSSRTRVRSGYPLRLDLQVGGVALEDRAEVREPAADHRQHQP